MNEPKFKTEYQALIKKLGFSKNLLDDLSQEITATGFAGDTLIPELVYLTLNTGRQSKPVSMVIKGGSGAGKSFSLNAGKQFVPTDVFHEFQGMSEKAIVYNDYDFKHKHIIISEAAGMADGDGRVLIRQLLSEGRIKYLTVTSTAKEGLKSETLLKEGPTGLIMTTTADELNKEDESRILSVNIRESADQIKQALLAKVGKAKGISTEADVSRWHKLFEFNQQGPTKVEIPYLGDLIEHLPLSHDRIKRDLDQFISLIETHALMHCFDREWGNEDTVIANDADYLAVYRLTNQALAEGLDIDVDDNLREMVEAVVELQTNPYDTVTTAQLVKHLGKAQYAISRDTTKAIARGYLEDQNPGQGRKAKFTLGDVELPSGSVLPAPEELFSEAPKEQPANDNRVYESPKQEMPW